MVTVPIHNARPQGGVGCCCCFRCCSCIHLGFLKTGPGKLKLAEIVSLLLFILKTKNQSHDFQVIGFFCQSLALQYGSNYSSTMGVSFQSFVTNVTWCFLTTFLLLVCYLFSPKSINLIKSSLFVGFLNFLLRFHLIETFQEVLFNILAALTYMSSCSYLGYVVNIVLEPVYMITPHYQVYPAMSAAYVSCFACFPDIYNIFFLCFSWLDRYQVFCTLTMLTNRIDTLKVIDTDMRVVKFVQFVILSELTSINLL